MDAIIGSLRAQFSKNDYAYFSSTLKVTLGTIVEVGGYTMTVAELLQLPAQVGDELLMGDDTG